MVRRMEINDYKKDEWLEGWESRNIIEYEWFGVWESGNIIKK